MHYQKNLIIQNKCFANWSVKILSAIADKVILCPARFVDGDLIFRVF